MNKKSITLRFKIFTLIIVVSAVFTTFYTYSVLYNKNSTYPKVNKGRLLTNSTKMGIAEALGKGETAIMPNSRYSYTVIDLKGNILFSTIKKYKTGSSVNLIDFLEYDNKTSREEPGFVKYSTPLIVKGTQAGTAVFLLPEKEFLPVLPVTATIYNLAPVFIVLLITVILSILLYISMKRDVFNPLAVLQECAGKMLKGDFSFKIRYEYDNEMGTFCHDFEAMRDELKYSKDKELIIKSNEKELLAFLSHDIKTPLTAINGYVSGIKDGIVKDKEGIDNYCGIILNRIKLLTRLLEDILEHSKAELNKMDISFCEFYCGDFFREIIDDLAIEVESKGLQFIYPDNIPNLLINGDRKRLFQVLYNLVSNSIKYSKEHGKISISFENDNLYIYVYVKDEGIGISSTDMPNIFNKFFRGEKSRNQNIPGSGLGLSISKYIIEAHGGFINCVESSTEGSVFCFTLPL